MSFSTALRAISIYCCYNHEDRAAWEKLEHHLAVLRRSGQIVIHDCYHISVGCDRKLEWNTCLDTADIVLLILSDNFVADDLCWEMMLQAMQRHWAKETRVVPIRLSPVYYKTAPFAQLSMLPKSKPITLWRSMNAGFENVVEGIDEIIEDLHKAWGSGNHAPETTESAPFIYEQTREIVVQSFESTRLLDLVQEDHDQ